ncbi:MAG: endonuclease III [Proteobacteria bacterium]|nr:endonuclease III [Pseudomonadota bacterium]
MTPKKRLEIFKRFRANNPSPTTELKYNSSFELLIAVVLSAQATDKGVNKITEKLFPVANTPKAILKLGEEELRSYVKSINYFKTKAANIFKTCQILVDQYDSKVPDSREALESLPGVGRKTANVILNVAFKKPTIAVDTHIFRVSNRTHLAIGKTPRDVEDQLNKIVPKEYIHDAHHWLVLHGRYTCIARKPRCGSCIIEDLCEYDQKEFD